jgi:hypothetical protein
VPGSGHYCAYLIAVNDAGPSARSTMVFADIG